MTVAFIIVIALAMILGPVLYLRPTARQTQQMHLRQEAKRLGLGVSLVSVPKPGEHHKIRVNSGGKRLGAMQVSCARYNLVWPAQAQPQPQHWRVERLAHTTALDEGDEFLLDRWLVDWRHASLPTVVANFLRQQLCSIGADLVVIVSDEQGIAVCWQERGELEVVTQIADFLAHLQQQILALETPLV